MNNDYVSTVYDERRSPKTDYPLKFTSYLFNRFNMKKGDKLLEIGCGRGDFLKAFYNLGIDSAGIDLCESSIRTLEGFHVKKLDISKDPIPFKDNTFDIVYHKSLIEHLYSPDHLMCETHRVLKPGGRVIVLVPDWISQIEVFYEDFTHCRPYDVTSLHDVLKVYEFSDIKTELFYQLPVVWKYPILKIVCRLFGGVISTPIARKLTELTSIKFFRWSVELMVLGSGVK